MKKKGGKISLPHKEKEEENIKLEFLRSRYESRKSGSGDINSDINSMVDSIRAVDEKIDELSENTDSKYSDKPDYEELKKRIEETREGSVYRVNCKNLDKRYLEYKKGEYNVYLFFFGLERLFGELNRECNELIDWFVHGYIERKEVEHEGIDSVFGI